MNTTTSGKPATIQKSFEPVEGTQRTTKAKVVRQISPASVAFMFALTMLVGFVLSSLTAGMVLYSATGMTMAGAIMGAISFGAVGAVGAFLGVFFYDVVIYGSLEDR